MDPNATFRLWLDAETYVERRRLAVVYTAWMANGGFPATYVGRDVVELEHVYAILQHRLTDGSEVRAVVPHGIMDGVEPVGKAVRS